MKHLDALGDRMKSYERACCGDKSLPGLPVCVRIDGKCFSKFTHDLARPYEEGFHKAMCSTMLNLMKESAAVVGYTQSDEITLILWNKGNPSSQIFFDGKIKKIVSVLSSMATHYFAEALKEHLPQKAGKPAFFDCRAWQVPTPEEAVNVLVWRELDATKNSISMAAQHYFSHTELMNKNCSEMQDMLM